ncbi:MAG: SpoIVB peptidase [Alicyclobacillus sp.]|nr:SpoIVB peptidase [Alicyclobacillus sp.]
MKRKFPMRYGRIASAIGLALLCMSPPVQRMVHGPEEVRIPEGQAVTLRFGAPFHLAVDTSDARVVRARATPSEDGDVVSVLSQDVGEATLSARLFGFLPWKAIHVSVVPRESVYVGGQSIGVVLHARGLMVIGFQRVGREQSSPAAEANVEIGDVVERVNGVEVRSVEQLRSYLRDASGPVRLSLRHGRTHRVVEVRPVTDPQGNRHLGLFVRERATGVGTLTFYDPDHHRFGALGHLVSDADTGQPIDGTGPVYASEVTGLVKGAPGKPGEKRGRFIRSEGELGEIDENTAFGVFGRMDRMPPWTRAEKVPVATPDQVHKGPAEMWTVMEGQQVRPYRVEIESLVRQEHPDTKSMVVRVTDPRLLGRAGGIVQGMSGSPLVQDGRLVGAVTHVFVSDPTRGYGVYALWMLDACNHLEAQSTLAEDHIAALQPRYLGPAHAGGV